MRRWLEGVVRALISALMYETFGPMRMMASFNLPWPHPQNPRITVSLGELSEAWEMPGMLQVYTDIILDSTTTCACNQ